MYVSIHAPRTGRDTIPALKPAGLMLFQSTRPVRDATGPCPLVAITPKCFNPRAPYGTRRRWVIHPPVPSIVSIHAPRTGRDLACYFTRYIWISVSIHAPRTGRDFSVNSWWLRPPSFNPRAPYGTRPASGSRFPQVRCFNPRAPYGTRPNISNVPPRKPMFQSTRPVRDATLSSFRVIQLSIVSIHAPRTGRDLMPTKSYWQRLMFQSTRPVRDATEVLYNDSDV